jgi:hypothetical protein
LKPRIFKFCGKNLFFLLPKRFHFTKLKIDYIITQNEDLPTIFLICAPSKKMYKICSQKSRSELKEIFLLQKGLRRISVATPQVHKTPGVYRKISGQGRH